MAPLPLLALVLAGFGCHTILGIHDGQPIPGDASTSGTGGGGDAGPVGDASAEVGVSATGGTGGSRPDGSGGRIGLGDAGGGGPGHDAAVSDGGEPDVAPTGGGDGGEADGMDARASDGGVDLAPADAAPPDASPTDTVPADVASLDGKNDAGMVSDAAACAVPWSGSNAPARVFTPSSTGSTACSVPGTDVPKLAAGLDMANFRGAAACGACLRVQAVTGATSVVVPVVERSTATGILLTRAAMDQIAQGADLVNVDWTLVACEVESRPVRYFIKDGTNSTYVGVQVRNSRYPLAAVSVVGTSTTIPLSLKNYNYWESTSAGAGPVTLRLTDINGQTFDDPGVKLDPQTEVVGKGQFPICR